MKNQIETDYKGKQIMKENKPFSKYDCVLQTLYITNTKTKFKLSRVIYQCNLQLS